LSPQRPGQVVAPAAGIDGAHAQEQRRVVRVLQVGLGRQRIAADHAENVGLAAAVEEEGLDGVAHRIALRR